MKICPRCQKTYADDNLNFCLEDGAVLTAASAQSPPQTVQVNQPQITQPQQPVGGQTAQGAWNAAPQQYAPQQAQPPKKSSKTWIWVLLILGAIALICGGGLVGFFFWAANQANQAANNAFNTNTRTTSTNKNSSTSSPSNSSRTDLTTIDLSMFVHDFSVYGSTSLSDGELSVSAGDRIAYYVLTATSEYSTENADTRVTLKNTTGASCNNGYGIVFHSNPTPLQQGYAFLIDTKRKKYSVVHHEPHKELTLVSWTASPAIKDGTSENTLEVRDHDGSADLYINGTMVTTVKDTYAYTGGVVGIYTGSGVKIVFKELEIRK